MGDHKGKTYKEHHDHRNGECDLPDVYDKNGGWNKSGGCYYTWTWDWINSGDARCGCPTCSDKGYNKQQNRRARKQSKRDIQQEYLDYEGKENDLY
jgi:hypothetical protein